jgi:hypothetical protein
MLEGGSQWLKVLGGVIAFAIIVPMLASLGILGLKGPGAVLRQVFEGIRDISEMSLRRIWALAMLTGREAIRRKALLVFVVFAILFMFGSWFLSAADEKADIQIERHVVFVFTAISWLILPVILMLACWGIPEDIKARSMHTVVTKPVRRVEIVLGRMLGFSLVASFIVALMGIVGYFWIERQLSAHVHERMVCKVPVYGRLSFLDRQGGPSTTGINVGDIWMFRSYIEGSTKASAIWDFDNITPTSLAHADEPGTSPSQSQSGDQPDVLRLQTNFEAFRSYKGVVNKGLLCELTLVNPAKKLRVPLPPFEVAEYRGDGNQTAIPRAISFYDAETKQQRSVDLINDVVSDGKLRIEARCLNPQQYLGMARPDLFVRMPDRNFAVGYFKALSGVWMQALVVVMIGVSVSCFLKGPIAALMAFSVLIIGQGFRELVDRIVTNQQLGGGPVESIYRMVTHMNQTVDMDLSPGVTWVMKTFDKGVENGLYIVHQTMPNFTYFRMSPYVAKGFDVDFRAAILPAIAVTLAYLIPCVLVGYYALKLRELESK